MDWNLGSLVATTIGLPVAGLSALLAVITYRNQVEAGADAHMHSLFRGYLEAILARIDNQNALKTLKLYTFEEMIDWVREQERDLAWWGWLRPLTRAQRKAELKEWERTVADHLGERAEKRELRERMDEFGHCYGKAFRDFVTRECAEPSSAPTTEPPAVPDPKA